MTPSILLLLLSPAGAFHLPHTSRPHRVERPSLMELAAQKMTPTRKTRREDSFDRKDDGEEKKDGALFFILFFIV
jgi:hypothetical protein